MNVSGLSCVSNKVLRYSSIKICFNSFTHAHFHDVTNKLGKNPRDGHYNIIPGYSPNGIPNFTDINSSKSYLPTGNSHCREKFPSICQIWQTFRFYDLKRSK